MRTLIIPVVFIFFIYAPLSAQSSQTMQDSAFADGMSTSQNIALYTMTGIVIPLAIGGTVLSVVPPSGGVVVKDGAAYGSFSFETGYGWGEQRETGIFTDYRLTLTYTHILSARVRDVYAAEIKRDVHFDFIDRRKIFLTGLHVSGGLFTDFPNHGYTVGSGVWLKSPWLPYIGLFPSHTYGITYRYKKYFSGAGFHEFSLGVTSAFTF
jgi:hypothetical protein